jgi:hypothetical protein
MLSDQVRENLLYKQQMEEIRKQVQQQLDRSPGNDTAKAP